MKYNRKHGMYNTRLYKIWQHMKERCSNSNCFKHVDYGGRGIAVCDEWLEFIPFMEWSMANGYTEHLTIDRKNNDGNYCPKNCRWTTILVQNNNRRDTVKIEFNGVIDTLTGWSKRTGINRWTLKTWHNRNCFADKMEKCIGLMSGEEL